MIGLIVWTLLTIFAFGFMQERITGINKVENLYERYVKFALLYFCWPLLTIANIAKAIQDNWV